MKNNFILNANSHISINRLDFCRLSRSLSVDLLSIQCSMFFSHSKIVGKQQQRSTFFSRLKRLFRFSFSFVCFGQRKKVKHVNSIVALSKYRINFRLTMNGKRGIRTNSMCASDARECIDEQPTVKHFTSLQLFLVWRYEWIFCVHKLRCLVAFYSVDFREFK